MSVAAEVAAELRLLAEDREVWLMVTRLATAKGRASSLAEPLPGGMARREGSVEEVAARVVEGIDYEALIEWRAGLGDRLRALAQRLEREGA